jgi:phosphoribosylformylglycinamidine cyclo-ligase
VAASRGESAYVVDVGPFYLASIVECLGSKALVADEMAALTGRSWYAGIAQDTIAMAVNDLITVGATPLVVQAYWAAGGSDWFGDAERAQALVAGWKAACDTCGVAWGGGETPALAGIVEAGRIDLAAVLHRSGQPRGRLTLGDRLGPGDAIVLLASSGIHANGLSLARKLAERLPQGYLTEVAPGLGYGEALLAPTTLYSPVTEALWPPACAALLRQHHRPRLAQAAAPSGAALPHAHRAAGAAGAAFIQQQAAQDAEEAYGTLNMGAGFALLRAWRRRRTPSKWPWLQGIPAWIAGTVEEGPKQLLIEPLGLRFADDALQLR